jgi:hypothetical protein
MKSDYNVIIKDKYVFYTEGAKTINDVKRAPKGAVLKTEAEKYILADDEVIDLSLKVALQQEKCDLLKSVLASISKRNFDIRAAIDYMKFMAGAN